MHGEELDLAKVMRHMIIGCSTDNHQSPKTFSVHFLVPCLSVQRRIRNHRTHRRSSKGRDEYVIFNAMRVKCYSGEGEIELERCAKFGLRR